MTVGVCGREGGKDIEIILTEKIEIGGVSGSFLLMPSHLL